MSLRSRLILAMVALVTVGLLAAGAATYGFLRASLLDRVDEQLRGSATVGVTRELFAPDRGPFARARRGVGGAVTYAGLLDASGSLTAERAFGFVANEAPPLLPAEIVGPVVAGGPMRFFTADSQGESAVRYRVLVVALGGGGAVALAIPLDDVAATLARLFAVEAAVTIAVLLAVVGVSLWLVRVGLQPLERIEVTAAEIAAGDLTRRVEQTDDRTEVGRLGTALNQMLERIETAFVQKEASEARLRRFVSDASHELRTPLTSIRGYAELFRRGADERPEDLAVAMRRIEDESARMGGLVDELLLLARLDQGRPLERAPVDVVAIATDAVRDARVVDPDRPIDMATGGAAMVEGDEARLRQVITNLISNAIVHTPAGAPVKVTVRSLGDAIVIEVADEGPGLPPEHVERAFDRFFRADPARARDSGGAGLGLSIASSIIDAHGGSIDLTSAPGVGTTVTVRLPRGT